MSSEKKMHNLKVENSVLFCGLSEDFKLRRQPLRIALRECSAEVREEPGYMGVFATKTR